MFVGHGLSAAPYRLIVTPEAGAYTVHLVPFFAMCDSMLPSRDTCRSLHLLSGERKCRGPLRREVLSAPSLVHMSSAWWCTRTKAANLIRHRVNVSLSAHAEPDIYWTPTGGQFRPYR
jgi:hypothetical protein